MLEWFKSWGVHFFGIILTIERIFHYVLHFEEEAEKLDKLLGIKKWIVRRIGERRNTMSIGTWIQDAEALIALEPVLMKFIEDAKAAAPNLEADAEALKTQLLAIFHPAPAAPPTGAV